MVLNYIGEHVLGLPKSYYSGFHLSEKTYRFP